MVPQFGHETARVRLLHDVRQFFIGCVASKCPCSHVGNTKWSACRLPSVSARSRSSIRAISASAFSGMILAPAFVFVEERRMVIVIPVQSTAFHRSRRSSQLRHVVLSAKTAAQYAICHSG